ncbi:MAG TPA: hypothetical protein VGO09_04135, partial [Flavisolibacter sp.]|nr:hypothetical protein [Flavisolibacter sp.]
LKGDVMPVDSIKKNLVSNKKSSVFIRPVIPVCKVVASGNDFFRIRRDMAARTTDELMVEEAKRFFRKECFTTEQIRNLSSLFLTASGKYLLFEAAYMHVSDRDKFPDLQLELRDDYYLKRFKTMVGE